MNQLKENICAIALREVLEKGPKHLYHLVRLQASPVETWAGLKERFPQWRDFLSSAYARAEETFERAEAQGIEVLYPGDGSLSPQLLQATPPVSVLFLLGDKSFLSKHCVGVVGTRKPSPYGVKVTRWVVEELVARDIVVVSGMALGIDGCAHRTALDAGGCTVAVLGSGVDVPHPRTNLKIYRSIIDSGGAVISEYPPGQSPKPYHFPARNRIIAALSECLVVTEAPRKSGALITAMHAAEMGKDVFAVPGPVFSDGSRGANYLIKSGAHPLIDPSEVLPEVTSTYADFKGEERENLTEEEKAIVNAVSQGINHFDLLCSHLEEAPEKLLSLLTQLELKGLIVKLGTQIFLKRSRDN